MLKKDANNDDNNNNIALEIDMNKKRMSLI